jgi:hypothetical protein
MQNVETFSQFLVNLAWFAIGGTAVYYVALQLFRALRRVVRWRRRTVARRDALRALAPFVAPPTPLRNRALEAANRKPR